MQHSASLEKLIQEFKKMPGVGAKSAERLAFYILKISKERAGDLANAINDVKEHIKFCSQCFSITESDLCNICKDSKRDLSVMCVVEEPKDLIAIEKTGTYKGLYHVLLGSLSPLRGIVPDDIKIKELLLRIQNNSQIKEIIIATNPNTEGETTAIYLARLIKPFNIKTSRIASGIPMGGNIEYIDELTLGKALEGRREV